MAQPDRSDLIASAAAGDEVAFRHIIVAYHDDMRRVCSYVTRDEVVADEAAQAAWSVAWKKIGSVRDPARLRPWLVSVAVNEAKKLMSKRRRRADFELATDMSNLPGGLDPASGIDLVDLWAAVRRMDPDDRALLTMRYGVGFNSSELAIATGKTPAAIRQRLKRLVDRLREDLSHD